jgi:hypothetical protein
MNFASIKDDFDPDSPRAVVWQYTDPYQPPNVPDPDPMLPQTLLMAYEENGRGMLQVLLRTIAMYHLSLPRERIRSISHLNHVSQCSL